MWWGSDWGIGLRLDNMTPDSDRSDLLSSAILSRVVRLEIMRSVTGHKNGDEKICVLFVFVGCFAIVFDDILFQITLTTFAV